MSSNKEISFENHFNLKVIEISFHSNFHIKSSNEILKLKKMWRENLQMWHSPYSCIIDVTNIYLDEALKSEFDAMIRFFKSFFMKKLFGYCTTGQKMDSYFSFVVFDSYAEARESVGLNRDFRKKSKSGLRDEITIENDFNEHVMEISFDSPVIFQTKEDVESLRSKVKNMLRMWHTPYSVLINCQNCRISPDILKEFIALESFLKGFFCKRIIGYAPCESKEHYPFQTHRSRHLAVKELTHSGLSSGSKANCSTRKSLGDVQVPETDKTNKKLKEQ